jgi:hypothetical protein
MANPDSVAQLYFDSFSNARVAYATTVSMATAGNAVANLAINSGGLTNGGAVSNSGAVIIRKITATTLNGAVSSAYVTITTSNDGNASNAVVANVALSSLTAQGKFQDLTIASPYTTTVLSGSTSSALFVNVTTPSGNTNTVNFSVYGDVVSF